MSGEAEAAPPRRQTVTVYNCGGMEFSLIPIASLPDADPEITVTPWGDASQDDWLAEHILFSLRWDPQHAEMSSGDVTTEACSIAARLLTGAGRLGAATLHRLPMVDFRFDYLVRVPKAAE